MLWDEFELLYCGVDEVKDYGWVKTENDYCGYEDENGDKQFFRFFKFGFVFFLRSSRVHVVHQPQQIGGLENAH